MASTPRNFDRQSGEWTDGEAVFLRCNIWRQAAENVAESLTRGARVIVSGRLKQRSFETREGEKRTVFELEVDEIGASLAAEHAGDDLELVVHHLRAGLSEDRADRGAIISPEAFGTHRRARPVAVA